MALPITVPYVFGNVTTSIPLTNLDSDFATIYAAVNGIGNGTVALANVSITGGSIQNVSVTLDTINNTPIGNTTPSTGAFTSLTDTGLTSGRVTYATTGGLLTDSANLTFDGSTLTTLNAAYTGTLTGGTGVVNLGSGQFYKDASGNVGIGITNPSSFGKLAVAGGNIAVNLTSNSTASIDFWNSANTKINQIKYDDADGSLTIGSVTGGAYVTKFQIAGTERMRIDSSGNLLVGTTSTNGKLSVVPSTSQYGIAVNAPSSSGTYYLQSFLAAGTVTGSITSNGTLTVYATTSDYRLKENIKPMVGALATVAELKPVTYDWAKNKASGQGFIAHELQAVIPDAVVGVKDAVDSEGNPVYQQIDTAVLVATLAAAIQEQQALIESLTTRLTALENK